MLRKVYIKNYALIDEIQIDFKAGFTTITGETGAGKSIILGALSLVLGERAELSKIKNGEGKSIVEAEFELPGNINKSFFEEHGLDYDRHTILRRELLSSGKSRAFINDTPVSLKQMRELGSQLIDIHSQNENISLNTPEFQLSLLDDFADLGEKRRAYQNLFRQYQLLSAELESLLAEQNQHLQNKDFWQFQFDELDEADLVPGEEQNLEERIQLISNSEALKGALYQVSAEIGDSENDIISSLRSITNKLEAFKGLSEQIASVSFRLESNRIELEDIQSELDDLSTSIDFNASELSDLEKRIDLLNHLMQKHRLNSSEKLIKERDEFYSKLNGLNLSDENLKLKQEELKQIDAQLTQLEIELSDRRNLKAPVLEEGIEELLHKMSIPQAKFSLHMEKTRRNSTGIDKLSFRFSANEGQEAQDISKVASGGERSRLMLALRYVLSVNTELPAIILDEIDTGISGEVARQVAEVLLKMATRMQVISITHLPQIAAKGQSHLSVFKNSKGTQIQSLSQEERVVEIAQMLSGAEPSAEAKTNAQQLLN